MNSKNFFPIAMVITWASFSAQAEPVEYSGNGNYYETLSFYDTGRMDWTEAEAYAQNLSFDGVHGNLASVTDSGIDNFLWGLGAQGTFIGGYETTNGNWQWLNGQAFSYTNWAPGEPNNWNGTIENYAMYWWGTAPAWNDTNKDSSYIANGNTTYTTWGFSVEFAPGNLSLPAVPVPSDFWMFATGLAFLGIGKKQRNSQLFVSSFLHKL